LDLANCQPSGPRPIQLAEFLCFIGNEIVQAHAKMELHVGRHDWIGRIGRDIDLRSIAPRSIRSATPAPASLLATAGCDFRANKAGVLVVRGTINAELFGRYLAIFVEIHHAKLVPGIGKELCESHRAIVVYIDAREPCRACIAASRIAKRATVGPRPFAFHLFFNEAEKRRFWRLADDESSQPPPLNKSVTIVSKSK